MTDKINEIWNITRLLLSSETDNLANAFKYLLAAAAAADGTLWYAGEELLPFYTTEQAPDNKLAASVVAEGSAASRGDTLCIPLRCDEAVWGCLQISGAGDRDFVAAAVLLFEKYLEETKEAVSIPQQGQTVIALRDIRKSYNTAGKAVEVLRGISFDIYENELLVILGASGTGKTTLLNIIGGLDKADSGSIIVGDMDISQADSRALTAYRRDEVGFVFQFYSLMPNLTAAENLSYIAELVPREMTVQSALEKVNLWDKRNNYPAQLSSGQQQRVAIARALIKMPRIILADEPTGALDLSTSKDVLIALEEIAASGQGTVVIITHNTEICKIADRVIHLRQGLIDEITVNLHKISAAQLRW